MAHKPAVSANLAGEGGGEKSPAWAKLDASCIHFPPVDAPGFASDSQLYLESFEVTQMVFSVIAVICDLTTQHSGR